MHAPTRRRLHKAYEAGNIPHSGVFCGALFVMCLSIAVWSSFDAIRRVLYDIAAQNWGGSHINIDGLGEKLLLPLTLVGVAIWLASVLIIIMQRGLLTRFTLFAPRNTGVRWADRFSAPLSLETLRRVVFGTLLIVVVTSIGVMSSLQLSSSNAFFSAPLRSLMPMAAVFVGTLAVGAALHLRYTRHRYYASLEMTRAELLIELRDTEGQPQYKQERAKLRNQGLLRIDVVLLSRRQWRALALQRAKDGWLIVAQFTSAELTDALKVLEYRGIPIVDVVFLPNAPRGSMLTHQQVLASYPDHYRRIMRDQQRF